MNKLVIFILFSAVMITLVLVTVIPDLVIPGDDYGNMILKKKNTANPGYQIEKTTDVACVRDSDCVTPGEYLIQSRCPFTSKCIGGKCAVICPKF